MRSVRPLGSVARDRVSASQLSRQGQELSNQERLTEMIKGSQNTTAKWCDLYIDVVVVLVNNQLYRPIGISVDT